MRTRVAMVMLASVMTLAIPAAAAPLPADLTTWTPANQPFSGGGVFGAVGNWVVDSGGTSVVQTVNGRPTFFVSPEEATDKRITASFTTPAVDDDVFGIALGFSTDPADPATDYLLIDWRQDDQSVDWEGTGLVIGTTGLAVSRVTGVPSLNELWSHTDSLAHPGGGVQELGRGATLGNVAWADSTTYSFVIEYTTTSLEVSVNGSPEIAIAGSFPTGPLALYDFSQADMTMSGITTEVLNDPPQVVGGGAPDVTVSEGALGGTSGAFTDSDGDALTLVCTGSCTGFVDNLDGSWSWSQSLPEGPESFAVTVTASDGVAEPVADTFQVTVLNLAPVIVSTTGVGSIHDLGNALEVSADFTDAGVLDTHTATFSWGDGTTSPGLVAETPGSGTTTGSHLYADPGFYTVSVTVTDDDGGSDTAVLGEVFVFDPDTFVTGGGWITSPAGAWVAQPAHTGKATFGFIARYDRLATVRGSLEVQLHKGLNVKATSFDYLLIDDGVAVFEGEAKVNGIPGFSFRVVATDERHAPSSEDLFELTLWDGGGIVYDTGGSHEIVGLGIQIHEK